MPPVVETCCGRYSLKTGSIAIGVILLVFTVCFTAVTIGLVAGWEDFDTQFLDDRLARLNSTAAEKVRQELIKLKELFQKEIRPVWKNEFISLYCFLPWYALANVLLIIGAKKEIKALLIVWLLFTAGFLVWSFVLVSVMFSYDTTPGFVAGVAVAQIINFSILASFMVVVYSYYRQLVAKTILEVVAGVAAVKEDSYVRHEQT